MNKTAVLLINLGSPDAPTKKALRKYLRQFLSDERVVDLPRWLWYPILYGIVLTFRPKKSAKAYKEVWTENGAPLICITEKQTNSLKNELKARGLDLIVDYAMRYGSPSIDSAFAKLAEQKIERVLILPMYPQYSDATTASVFDGVAMALKKRRGIPQLRFINDWHDNPKYITALADSVRNYLQNNQTPDYLLTSFHGIPERFAKQGDPYYKQCQVTADLLQKQLPDLPIKLVFQSRFGREKWLTPYADETIEALAKQQKKLAIICPGFSADCLETLEEMAQENRELYEENGGISYGYIPALNDEANHIELLVDLVMQNLTGWLD